MRTSGLSEFRQEAQAGSATSLWRKTLSQVPTRFGRLVLLASLRDPLSGRYIHRPLIELVGRELTDRTLATSHHQVFAEWLSASLVEQKADLDDYLRQSSGPAEPATYRDLPPATAHDVERQLFLTDLETLLALLRRDDGGAASAPEASQLR